MDENQTYEYLMHHGVKGMKWGVRKSGGSGGPGRADFWKKIRNPLASNRPRPAVKRASKAPAKAAKSAPKEVKMNPKKAAKLSAQREKEWVKTYRNRSRMSDTDLKKALARLELENRMAQQVKTAAELTAPEQSRAKQIFQKTRDTSIFATRIIPDVLDALPPAHQTEKTKAAAKQLRNVNKLLKSAGG